MLKVIVKPHRTGLRSGDSSPQKLFVLLKVIPSREVASARPPLALALVLDTSLSMRAFLDQEAAGQLASSGSHAQGVAQDGAQYRSLDATLPTLLDSAIEAAHAMIDDARLSCEDLISIIHFDDNARALWPLASLQDKVAIHAAIEKLRRCAGETQMAKGLAVALSEMKKTSGAVVRRVIVFTDGATGDEAQCRSLAHQFYAMNAPLVAIGFGPEYNAGLMKELADSTGGRPYHLQKIALMREVLNTEIGQSTREVVTDLKLQVKAVQGVQLECAHRVFPSLSEVPRATALRLGNVAMGEYTAFILEFTIEGLSRTASRARLAQLQLTARVPGNEVQGVSTQAHVLPVQNLIVEFTHDEQALAHTDDEVLGYVQQRNVGSLVESAIDRAQNDTEGARQQLQSAAALAGRVGNASATRMLQNALGELERTGEISPDTRRTVALGVRTRTVSLASPQGQSDPVADLSDDEIRHLSGT